MPIMSAVHWLSPMAVSTLLFVGASASWAADRPPNIVLIVSDDQGFHDLGVLHGEVLSPNLDRLVKEGVRFSNFYVAWPACTPSRGALLTGRYPQRNGMYDMIRNEAPDYGHRYTPEEYALTFERIAGMDLREKLLPEYLKRAGYRTAIYGKWDLGSLRRFLPLQRGFDDFYGFVNTGIDYFTHERYGVPSMYDRNQPTTKDKGTYCTYLFGNKAEQSIKQNREHPFFLYLPFNAPHSASNLDPEIRSAAQAPETFKQLYPHLSDRLVPGTRYGKPAMVASRSKRRLEYLASITCMDAEIGKVLDLLDQYELSEQTLVLFLSDNGGGGGSDNHPLRGHKGQMFEGGIRVCAAARFPGRIPAGSVCDEFLTSLEILPTLIKLAGVEPDPHITLDGFDMLPVLSGKTRSPRREMFWKRRERAACRYQNWKWIHNAKGTYLFDLSRDEGEQHNLADSRPEIVQMMESRFRKWEEQMETAEPRGPFKNF